MALKLGGLFKFLYNTFLKGKKVSTTIGGKEVSVILPNQKPGVDFEKK